MRGREGGKRNDEVVGRERGGDKRRKRGLRESEGSKGRGVLDEKGNLSLKGKGERLVGDWD